jgi:hypothetical protein
MHNTGERVTNYCKPMDDQYHLLGLGPAASVISAMELSVPGYQVLVKALYDPLLRMPYQILFSKCRDVRLTHTGDAPQVASESPLIGILLGQRSHQSPAVITTDDFELSILYHDFVLLK